MSSSKFFYSGDLWIKIVPSKRLFNSTTIHEAVTRGSIFALRIKDSVFTILPSGSDKIEIKDTYHLFDISKGQLTKTVLIDFVVLDLIKKYSWCIACTGAGRDYVASHVDGNWTGIHRVILGIPFGDKRKVDHVNGDPFDNRIENLRICTHAENTRNRTKLNINNTSNYKGVYFRKDTKKWQAEITVDRSKVSLGSFKTVEAAAKAYNDAAVKYHGDFASLNVIK